MLRRVYFGPTLKLEVLLKLAALPFLEEACYAFVAGVWEAELLAVRVLAGCVGLAMVMRWMFVLLSISLTLLLPRFSSFAGVPSLLLMSLKGSVAVGLLRPGGRLC